MDSRSFLQGEQKHGVVAGKSSETFFFFFCFYFFFPCKIGENNILFFF